MEKATASRSLVEPMAEKPLKHPRKVSDAVDKKETVLKKRAKKSMARTHMDYHMS